MISGTAAAFIAFSYFGLLGNTVHFDNQKPGSFPPDWTATQHWQIQLDDSAPSRPAVFARISPSGEFKPAIAIFDKAICRDGELSVKFKFPRGKRQTGTAGILWRVQDPRNYYLLQFSAAERKIGLFRVQNGQAHPIPAIGGKPGATGLEHDLRDGQWYVAKAVFRGSQIRVFFGNRQLFDASDDSIAAPGKTGLWTSAGTAASFDDFRIDKKG